MIDTFVFNIDSPFLKVAVEECRALAERVIIEAYPDEHPLPKKFLLCLSAANKMLEGEAVSKEELSGMLDTIGGYYCATKLYCRTHNGDMERLKHAEELLRFAKRLNGLVRPFWKLDLIKG